MEAFLYQAPPQFDYLWLLEKLQDYASPRSKITSLLKNKDIIRVKKGLYVLGKKYNKPFSKEVLANLIHGPSYISLESALAHYGLIPERVETVASITTKQNKTYLTPIGRFTYKYLTEKKYAVGIDLVQISEQETSYIATKEKAICDLLVLQKNLQTIKDIEFFLFEDLRIDSKTLQDLDLKLIDQIQEKYKKKVLQKFFALVITSQKGCS